MQLLITFRRALLTLSLTALAGCGSDQQLTDPTNASLAALPAYARAKPPAPKPHTGHHAQPGSKGRSTTLSTSTWPAVAACDLQAYAVTSMTVGTSGGKLKVGRHEFDIPKGALSSSVKITMEAVADSVHSVRFSPAGLVFNDGFLPKLKLDYKGCRIPHGVKKQVVYVDESLQILSVLAATDDTLSLNVDANLEHFSRYAVAW